jgi:hypothetical protein
MARQHISSTASQSYQPSIWDSLRLTETERPGSEDSAKEVPVMHLYVPRASAVDPNARQREKVGHYILARDI